MGVSTAPIRYLRKDVFNLSQSEVAKALGVAQQWFSDVESGKIAINETTSAVIQAFIIDLAGRKGESLIVLAESLKEAGQCLLAEYQQNQSGVAL